MHLDAAVVRLRDIDGCRQRTIIDHDRLGGITCLLEGLRHDHGDVVAE